MRVLLASLDVNLLNLVILWIYFITAWGYLSPVTNGDWEYLGVLTRHLCFFICRMILNILLTLLGYNFYGFIQCILFVTYLLIFIHSLRLSCNVFCSYLFPLLLSPDSSPLPCQFCVLFSFLFLTIKKFSCSFILLKVWPWTVMLSASKATLL